MTSRRSLAEAYHQMTKYFREEVTENPRRLDWATQPAPHKEYHSERKVELVHYLPFPKNPFTGGPLEPRPEGEGEPFGLAELSRLLYFSNGVTGMLQYPNGNMQYFRAAPSAGALYPTEIYLAVRDIPSLDNGVYNFQVRDHSIIPLWDGNFWDEFERYCFGHEAISQSRLLLILTGVYERSAWRYQDRAYRRILLDTGHILGNINVCAKRQGFGVYPISGFFDGALNQLLFLDEEEEGVLTMCAMPRLSDLQAIEIRKSSVYPSVLTEEKSEGESKSLLLRLHLASRIGKGEGKREGELPDERAREEKYRDRPAVPFKGGAIDWGSGIEETIFRRRSTRAYSGDGFKREELASVLTFSYEPAILNDEGFAAQRGLPQVFDPSLLETYVVVHDVGDLERGIYCYAPKSQELRLIRTGDFRREAWEFSLGQELGRDAAALVIHTSNLPAAVAKYGDRAYRYLHLDAGHIGQRLNLAALRLNLGASGIGGFFDDEVNRMLEISLDQAIIYITTLGVPGASGG